MEYDYGLITAGFWQGNKEVFREKLVPVPLCPPQI
jgi:hypothetical protein